MYITENDKWTHKESNSSHDFGSFIDSGNAQRFKLNQSEDGSRNYNTDFLNKDKENLDPQVSYQTYKGSE